MDCEAMKALSVEIKTQLNIEKTQLNIMKINTLSSLITSLPQNTRILPLMNKISKYNKEINILNMREEKRNRDQWLQIFFSSKNSKKL